MLAQRMRTLKMICLLMALLCVAGVVTGIQSISLGTAGTTMTRLNDFGRLFALATAVVLVAFTYGIHVRAKITWKAGFILLALSSIHGVAGAVIATYQVAVVRDFPSFWLPVCIIVVLASAVTVYWSFAWNRQRSYFY
jgi:hypothetical protein